MRPSTRTGILLALLATAVVAALPFRKPAPADTDPASLEIPIERRLAAGEAERWSDELPPRLYTPEPHRVPTVATGASMESLQEPPELAPRYHRAFSPVGALLTPSDDLSADDSSAEAAYSEPQRLDLTSAEAGAQALTHPIADGDSLRLLAQRYLGDAERWEELYQYNSDILRSPDLLPIGKILRIPMGRETSVMRDAGAEGEMPLAPIPRGAFHER